MKHFHQCTFLFLFIFFSNIEIRDSIFEGNKAGTYGDDLYFSQDKNLIFISSSIFDKFYSNSVYLNGVMIHMEEVEFRENSMNSNDGAAIQCVDCIHFELKDSKFSNLQGKIGGAINFQQVQETEETNTLQVKRNIILNL